MGFRRKKKEPKEETKDEPLKPSTPSAESQDDDALAKFLAGSEIKFENKSDTKIIKSKGEIDGSDVFFDNLKGCTVVLADTVGAVRMHNVHNCKFYIGACASSLH